MGVLAGLAVAGSVIKGVGGLKAGIAAKRSAFAEARQEEGAAQEEERQSRLDARRVIGQQLAAQFANGLEGGTGTAVDAIRESQVEAALDVMEIRRQGAARAEALRKQGRIAKREGIFSLGSSLIGGATDFLKSQSDFAQARRGSSSSGSGG